MIGYRDMDDPSTVVCEDHEDKEQPKVAVGTTNRSATMIWLAWLVRKVRHFCDGGRRCRRMYLATVD
jgi:hypothetical protein